MFKRAGVDGGFALIRMRDNTDTTVRGQAYFARIEPAITIWTFLNLAVGKRIVFFWVTVLKRIMLVWHAMSQRVVLKWYTVMY